MPENTMEQMVRVAIEKGRLHHLLFDAGESMGSAVMNRILGTLFNMPPPGRRMAARSVQVHAVLPFPWFLKRVLQEPSSAIGEQLRATCLSARDFWSDAGPECISRAKTGLTQASGITTELASNPQLH